MNLSVVYFSRLYSSRHTSCGLWPRAVHVQGFPCWRYDCGGQREKQAKKNEPVFRFQCVFVEPKTDPITSVLVCKNRQKNDFRFSVHIPGRTPSVLRAIGVRRLAGRAAGAVHLLDGSLAISSGGSDLGEPLTVQCCCIEEEEYPGTVTNAEKARSNMATGK